VVPAAQTKRKDVPAAARPQSRPAHPSWSTLRGLIARPAGAVGCALVLLHLALAVAGPALAPYSATEFHMEHRLAPPSAQYLLGTDQFGRDIFSRVLVGAPGIMILATSATALGLALGTAVGLAAGYFGGFVDEVLMRLMDALMSFPSLLLALLILTMVGPATSNVVIGIGFVFMPRVARVVRSAVLSQRTLEYVQAARVRGESALYIMTREILPNIRGPIVVEAAIRVSYAILLGASLGFLGLGVQPPTPDWGLMVSEARNFLLVAPWVALAPAAAIATLVVGVNLVADGICREADR
jgi:peptide/nickel transport system permease protein